MKQETLTPREKALLTIIIAEIQDCQDMEGIKAITNSWVTANDLHPEKVVSLNEEEMKKLSRTGCTRVGRTE